MENIPARSSLNREDIAWVAGLICGEGCFTVHDLHGKPYPRFVLAQKDPEILWDMYGIIGFGNINAAKNKNLHWWSYEVNGFARTQFIACITWHYLSTEKKEQCLRVMKKYHAKGRKGRFNGGIRPKKLNTVTKQHL